jgi:hypothetical protein
MRVLEPRDHVAWQLRDQARACEVMGSPLYAFLLRRAAEDVERGGPSWTVLAAHVASGRGGAVALRFLAAVHRLVLQGRLPDLARHYPSAGGSPGLAGAWEPFERGLEHHAREVRELVARPCQTNDVGRCAGLAFGFLEIAAAFGLPLRLLEVGASAGLNLRWDHYRYEGGSAAFGDPSSPVQLTGLWRDAPPSAGTPVAVAERLGCDLHPLDPSLEADRLSLRASIWADQPLRLARLDGALEIARRVPVHLERASLERWLPALLAEPRQGVATVVYHSVVSEYLSAEARALFHATLAEAGTRAEPAAPLAWLRLEPTSEVRHHALTLTLWPPGSETRLAVCGAHGSDVTAVR